MLSVYHSFKQTTAANVCPVVIINFETPIIVFKIELLYLINSKDFIKNFLI